MPFGTLRAAHSGGRLRAALGSFRVIGQRSGDRELSMCHRTSDQPFCNRSRTLSRLGLVRVVVRSIAVVGESEAGGTAMSNAPGHLKPVVRKRTRGGSPVSGLSFAGEFVLSPSRTSAVVTPRVIPSAYTGATVVPCERLSNPGVKRTVQRRCRWIPVARCAPAAAQLCR